MKTTKLFMCILVALLLSSCGAVKANTPPPTAIPPVVADKTIVAEGRIEPVQYAEVAFNTGGIVSDVLVKEGDTVRKGQVLIRLGGETDKSYAAAQLELVTAQQAYDNLLNSSGTEAAQAVIDLKAAREAFDKAEDYLKYIQESNRVPQTETRSSLVQTWKGFEYRYKTKSFKGPAPEEWIIDAQNDLVLKKAELEEAQRTYDRLKSGVDTDQLALLEARLNASKAGVAALTVVSPFDGVVAKLNAKVGESMNTGVTAVTIADFAHWLVKTTDLTEIDVVNIAVGQPVSVVLDALPDVTLAGQVDSIAKTFAEKQGDVVYEVTISLKDTNPAILWGMTAVVKFQESEG